MAARKKSTRKFQAEVSRLLHLVVNSLYSNKEIFLRELVSNASDAIDRLKLASLTDESLQSEDGEPSIRLFVDTEARTLTIEDDGIGMTRDELAENLGTLAHSGTMAFLEQLEDRGDAQLIGQFGVGFYSAFLVADRVEVTSLAAGEDQEAWTWASEASDTYSIEPAEMDSRGTRIVLHVKEELGEFLDPWRLRSLVTRYSDYVSHPILLEEPRPEGEPELSQVNKANALWQRPASEIEDEQYTEFYRHLTHDWRDPLTHTHFKIEGTQLFTGMLFVPSEPPHDLFMRDHRRGVRLFVRRVFIMDDAEDLVPVWLRFVRGVIDSDDLPLNVSREMLQDSHVVRTIRKQVIKKTLERLGRLAEEDAEKYETFWGHFGAVLKEGLHVERDQGDRIAPLLRYRSSASEEMTSLSDYVSRMKEGQESIYYVIGESSAALAGSPHLEGLLKKGYEVLYMTDPIDEWAVTGLGSFDDKPFVSAMKADLALDGDEADEETSEEKKQELQPLLDRFSSVLGEKIAEVRLSHRLTDSPCCLVIPEGGQHAYLERLLKSQDPKAAQTPRILEINPEHPLVGNLAALHGVEPEGEQLTTWIELLYDQVLLTEGSPVADPNRLARRMTALMEQATQAALQG